MAENLFDDAGVINDGDNPHWILANGAAKRVHVPDPEDTWSVDKSYFLCKSGSKTSLPFLKNRDWEKIVPVPSTNLWVAIERPKRRGKRDDFNVVVFQGGHVIHKRLLKSLALREDAYYTGFLHFSPSRWAVWYPAQDGQVQYDLLRDVFICPLQEWGEGEGERIRGRGPLPARTR